MPWHKTTALLFPRRWLGSRCGRSVRTTPRPCIRTPRDQLARLAERGLLHRLTDGYYVVVPQDMVGRQWMPGLEAAAGIGAAVYGADDVVVTGISAARLHGAIPRALATAIIAVPQQHRPIALADRPAIVRFVKRQTSELDAELIRTELGLTLVTTPEQPLRRAGAGHYQDHEPR